MNLTAATDFEEFFGPRHDQWCYFPTIGPGAVDVYPLWGTQGRTITQEESDRTKKGNVYSCLNANTRQQIDTFASGTRRVALLGGKDAESEELLESFLSYFPRSLHHVDFKWVSKKSCSLPPATQLISGNTSHAHIHSHNSGALIIVRAFIDIKHS